MIPHLRELCYQRNDYDVDPNFVEKFINLHSGDWRTAQSHWEVIVAKVLNTDAVRPDASGDEAILQAISATEVLLTRTRLRARCPVCPTATERLHSRYAKGGAQ